MKYKVTLIIDDGDDSFSNAKLISDFLCQVLANCDLYVDKEEMQLEQIEESEPISNDWW
jgi:hypothetical protein